MKPIVIGRYYVDNYLVLFITKTLVNVTSVDCSDVSIFNIVYSKCFSIWYPLKRQPQAQEKSNKGRYIIWLSNVLWIISYKISCKCEWYEIYNKYTLSYLYMMWIEVGENLEYKLQMNTNLP